MSNDQIEIFEVPEFLGNAYILQTEGDYLEALYSAPRFWNETIDHQNWALVEDQEEFNKVVDSAERTIIATLDKSVFNNFINQY